MVNIGRAVVEVEMVQLESKVLGGELKLSKNHILHTKLIVMLVAFTFLASCGGGGGNKLTTDSPNSRPPSSESPGDSSPSQLTLSVSSDPNKFGGQIPESGDQMTISATESAAKSKPKFGSVEQSSIPITNVTATRTDAKFDFTIMTGNTSNAGSFNTGEVASQVFFDSEGHNRKHQDAILLYSDNLVYTAVGVSTEYDANEFGDWIAAGYWLHITGGEGSAGAFIEGPEITTPPSSLPDDQTASYVGQVKGLFAYQDQNSTGFGDYGGDFIAEANFGTNTVSGRIENIVPTGYKFNNGEKTPIIRDSTSGDFPYGAGIVFVGGSINDKGEVIGQTKLTLPGKVISTQSGYWGSKLSSIIDENGNPRLIAGTHGVNAETGDGITVNFLGAHYGVSCPFQQDC